RVIRPRSWLNPTKRVDRDSSGWLIETNVKRWSWERSAHKPLIDHILAVRQRIDVRKTAWPTVASEPGGRAGAEPPAVVSNRRSTRARSGCPEDHVPVAGHVVVVR